MPATLTPAILARATQSNKTQPDETQPDRPKSAAPIPPREPHQSRQPATERLPIQNRVHVLLVHIPKLSIQGQARLAAEVGVSRSTISRLVGGRINPSYRLARGVTTALEKLLGYPLDMREVFSTDGTYPTPSGCALCRCGGCLPDRAYDPEGDLRPEWRGQRPGDWSLTPAIHTSMNDSIRDSMNNSIGSLQDGTIAEAEGGAGKKDILGKEGK